MSRYCRKCLVDLSEEGVLCPRCSKGGSSSLEREMIDKLSRGYTYIIIHNTKKDEESQDTTLVITSDETKYHDEVVVEAGQIKYIEIDFPGKYQINEEFELTVSNGQAAFLSITDPAHGTLQWEKNGMVEEGIFRLCDIVNESKITSYYIVDGGDLVQEQKPPAWSDMIEEREKSNQQNIGGPLDYIGLLIYFIAVPILCFMVMTPVETLASMPLVLFPICGVIMVLGSVFIKRHVLYVVVPGFMLGLCFCIRLIQFTMNKASLESAYGELYQISYIKVLLLGGVLIIFILAQWFAHLKKEGRWKVVTAMMVMLTAGVYYGLFVYESPVVQQPNKRVATSLGRGFIGSWEGVFVDETGKSYGLNFVIDEYWGKFEMEILKPGDMVLQSFSGGQNQVSWSYVVEIEDRKTELFFKGSLEEDKIVGHVIGKQLNTQVLAGTFTCYTRDMLRAYSANETVGGQ